MDRLNKHLENIEKKLGSTEKLPSSAVDPLDWHLNKIESLIEGGGGGNVDDVTINGTSVVENNIADIKLKTVEGESIVGEGNISLDGYYKNNASILPDTTAVYDIGSSSFTFKDLYLSGKIDFGGNFSIKVDNNTLKFFYDTSASLGISSSTIYANTVMATSNVRPQTDNTNDIGNSTRRYKDIYFSGSFKDGTRYATLLDLYSSLNPSGTGSTEIKWTKMLTFTLSADTTLTFEDGKSGCVNEYKAIIMNGSSSSIVLTFSGVSHILCNDDNCIISNNTLTLPVGTTLEINMLNGNMVAVNFEA